MTGNAEIVRRVYEDGLNRRNDAVLEEFVAPGYVNHEGADLAENASGPANWSNVVARLAASFPDISWQVLRTLAQDDQVWIETTMSGTHKGKFFDFEPTGRSFRVRQVHMLRLEHDQIQEHWAVRDDLGILIQLGLIDTPMPARAAR